MTPDLIDLLQQLDAAQHRFAQLEAYYENRPPLAYLSADSKIALARFDILSVNVCRLQVNSLSERLRVNGFSGNADVWSEWVRNDLDQWSSIAHREALLFGASYAIVWADAQGRPQVTIESAKNVTVLRDQITRAVTVAAKRKRTKTTTEVWLYYSDRVEHWQAKSPSAGNAGFELIEVVRNPIGEVPVVAFVNADRLDSELSELDDLVPLVDALNKLLLDMLIASEFSGRPRRYATGIEATEEPRLDENGDPVLDEDGEPVVDTVNPYPAENRMMLAANEQAKFGQLEASDLAGFENGVKVITSMIMAVSSLPSHYLGVLQSQPTSADALRASEASLTARACGKQGSFGRAWENVGRLLIAVRDSVDPSSVSVRVVWADASTRSVAAEVDAAVKLFSSNLLSRTAVLRRLGYTDDDIAAELDLYRRDAQMSADITTGRYALRRSGYDSMAAA